MNNDGTDIIKPGQTAVVNQIGGKAFSLNRLLQAGFPVPMWFVVPPHVESLDGLHAAVAELGDETALFAVRSSSTSEDGAEQSFAGQFESYLAVRPGQVARRIADVRQSGLSERVLAYRNERGLAGPPEVPAVLVQRLVRAGASGVAFSADPVTGRRGVAVVSAVWGLGTALVGGDADADTFYVDQQQQIIHREIADKTAAHRPDPDAPDGIRIERIVTETRAPAITDEQVCAIAKMARSVARFAGCEQDIEWAIEHGRLWLLQSRPITTLRNMPDPDGELTIWDNSNIIESYPGITLPLTYSFARDAYEQVYRQFCRIMGVPAARVEDHANVFRNMIGLIRGRVYYHLINWYRVLALLPGFKANRSFMEQMMGVSKSLPARAMESPPATTRAERWADRLALGRSMFGMLCRHVTIERNVRQFHRRLDQALSGGHPLQTMRIDELAGEYRRLERELLTHWDAPLVNDFFAMIHFGLLGKLTARYTGQSGLHNALLADGGGMISAEPAKRIAAMAEIASKSTAITEVLCSAPVAQAEAAIASDAALHTAYNDYLSKFGERCMEELKLESSTLVDDPTPLLRSIGNAARRSLADKQSVANHPPDSVNDTQQVIDRALRGHPLRRVIFRWVLRNARARVTGRENLRFERTRVFGRVRRIVVEIGRRLAAENKLADARDVFYLELNEVLGFIEGTITCVDLRALAADRKHVYAQYHREPSPPDRFETRGAVHVGNDFAVAEMTDQTPNATPSDATLLQGTGCCAGRVTGRARVIVDPVGAQVQQGEILVAERTDPGWIMLFPAAAGVLVQRGSMLSHSAIVARELNIPAIVSIPQLMQRINTGDLIEMDGTRGSIRIISRNTPPVTSDTDAK